MFGEQAGQAMEWVKGYATYLGHKNLHKLVGG